MAEHRDAIYEGLMLPDTGLPSVAARQYLNDLYALRMGLYNLEGSTPLDAVGYNSKEDITNNDLENKRIRTYMDLEINKHTGLSLLDYLNQPPYIIDNINKMASDVSKQRSKTISDELDKLGLGDG